MITKDDIKKIQELRARGYSQSKIAQKLNISRATVARHWGHKKLTLDDLFLVSACSICQTVSPKPKFQHSFRCPYCKKGFSWRTPWFKPEGIESTEAS